jgi:hypothetical protein
MLEQVCAKRRLAKHFLFLALVGFLAVAGNTQRISAHAIGQTSTDQSAAVSAALQKSFGATVEAVTGFKPFYLTGDFNGDGAQDIVVVVRVKGARMAIPKDVRILNPFEPGGAIKFPANPAGENKLALVIIHDWKNPQPAGKFLLIGESPILILEYNRIQSGPDGAKNLMELMSRRGKRRKGEKLPPTSKGDVIVLGSEVGDSVLYWNGRTYRWEDSPDD